MEAQVNRIPETIHCAIEAMPTVADPAPVAGGLVERVAMAIHPDRCADPNLYLHEARAAILEVAKWLRERGLIIDADLLEQEAGR